MLEVVPTAEHPTSRSFVKLFEHADVEASGRAQTTRIGPRTARQEAAMARKKSGIPRKQRPKETTVAAHLPMAPAELQPHVATMCKELGADQRFGALKPQVDETVTDNGKLASAIQEAKNGGTVEQEALVEADKTVRDDIKALVPGVQKTLRGLPPDQVPGILAAILMHASHVGERPPKPPLAAKDVKGAPAGTALLVALAIAGTLYYEYDWSADQTTWTPAGKSGKARFTVAGLASGKQYWFRVTAFLRDGTSQQHVTGAPFIVR
jgi:hypothetical protein